MTTRESEVAYVRAAVQKRRDRLRNESHGLRRRPLLAEIDALELELQGTFMSTLHDECRQRVRFSMSDESGKLRFTVFKVLGASDCTTARFVQEHLVGRSLENIDWSFIEERGRQAGCTCGDDIISVLHDCRSMLGRLPSGT